MIYIIITTSINNKIGIKNDTHRQTKYTDSIHQLLELIKNDTSIKPIIVENNGLRHTYLDDFKCDIIYTNNNKFNFSHKGENELLDIKEVINHFNIQEDDIIIKITGRYKLLNLNFINVVKENKYDAFVKFFNVCTQTYMHNDCVLGLFAIKCKYLTKFNYKFIKSPECEFADYIRENVNNVMEIDQLYLECCFADDLRVLTV
jgi:hypothetical protein